MLKTGLIRVNENQFSLASVNFFSDKIAPFYKVTNYSSFQNANDNDLIESPNLNPRDNILLKEEIETIVSLYKLNEDSNIRSAPIFSVQVSPEKNYQYMAGEYGSGKFVLITNSSGISCANLLLEDCLSLDGFLSERQYTVISDTYTYVSASPVKNDLAKTNSEKFTEQLIIEPKSMAETVRDVVVEIFSDTTTYNNEPSEVTQNNESKDTSSQKINDSDNLDSRFFESSSTTPFELFENKIEDVSGEDLLEKKENEIQ